LTFLLRETSLIGMSVDKNSRKCSGCCTWDKMSHVTALCLATSTEKTKTLKSEVLAEVAQDYCLVGCDAVYFDRCLPVFWWNVLPPASRQESKWTVEKCCTDAQR
jgi:hypothetical protein